MIKRVITSISTGFSAALMPIAYAWIKVGVFEHGEFMAGQFVIACLFFLVVTVMVFAYPGWSER